LISAEAVHPIELAEAGASVDSLVLESTLQALAEARRGSVTCFAATKLQDVQRSIKHQTVASALRQLDSAWRSAPVQDLPVLAPVYGCILTLESRDHEATLSMLQRARESAPDADLSALIALTLLRLKRPQDARRALETALSEYCTEVGGLLAHVAGIIVRHPAVAAPGWVGRGPRLELVGELSPHGTSNVLDISMDEGPDFTQIIRDAGRDVMGAPAFSLSFVSRPPFIESVPDFTNSRAASSPLWNGPSAVCRTSMMRRRAPAFSRSEAWLRSFAAASAPNVAIRM